tara:strand:+ start:49 stop:420 length:372 start_codon:yes stop_codon:yes gene_type:complete
MGKTGIMSLVSTRPGLKKHFTTKGTLRKGTKKIDIGIEFVIYAKIDQISKSRKLTMWKAWEQLTQHRNFPALMRPHFQRMKRYKGKTTWRRLLNRPDWIKVFYKNNLVRSRLKQRLKEIDFTY